MTDEIKTMVTKVNTILSSDFNLISFDAMSPESLLQTLVDVLNHFNAIEKFDVKFTDRDETVRSILEALKRIQYRVPQVDNVDPTYFRVNIAQGEKKTVYHILQFVIENKDNLHQVTYLARFLLPLQLPPEALANPDVATLWEQYLDVMKDFTDAHKIHTAASMETAQLKELRNDINAIEIERDNVKKRIDRTQTRLDKIPQQDLLLEAAHFLRVEKDRRKELHSHAEDQTHSLSRGKAIQERLQKELGNARAATESTSAQQLLTTIFEETQVMEFMVKQKLPKEMRELQDEINLLENVIDEPNVSKQYIIDLQNQVDKVSKEIKTLVERKLAERGNQNDTLVAFRQQATAVLRNKELAAEKLNRTTRELREIESLLQQKQKLLEETIGEVILRGDERKQYVNTLRAKTSVYKTQRSELAAIKAEAADLMQTLENLKSQDPMLSSALQAADDETVEESITPHSEAPMEARGITEISRIVDGLMRAVKAAREKVTPLSQKLKPLRERIVELQDERDSKKLTFESIKATLTAESSVLRSEIAELEMSIKHLEKHWQEQQMEHDRAENLLQRVQNEVNENNTNVKMSVKVSLQEQIHQQEKLIKDLQERKEYLFKNQDHRAKQLSLWSDAKQLFEVKIQCLQNARASKPEGTLSIQQNSETFTLQ